MWLEVDEQGLPREILDEHRRILAALESGETGAVLEAMREHRARSQAFIAALTPPTP
jgi:DNA-binding GntR family transcriptional regulator